MIGVSGIHGSSRTWRTRVRAITGARDREDRERTPPRSARVVRRPRTEQAPARVADATTAYFTQLLDQPNPRGLCADLGLRRAWMESYRTADLAGAPARHFITDERA